MTVLVALAMCVPLVVGGRVVMVATRDERPPADALIVLGAAASGGVPGRVLESRLDHARELYEAGVAPVIVTAGGTGDGQPLSEAQAGADWLIDHGVPAEAVIVVGSGADTLTSLEAVNRDTRSFGWSAVVLVSDPWHSYRARAMATDVGLPVVGTSPTSNGPNVTSGKRIAFNLVRETVAFIVYRVDTVTSALR